MPPLEPINVDAVPISYMDATAGKLYNTNTVELAVNAYPSICCPSCNAIASGLVNGEQLYTREVKTANGKVNKTSLPACPVTGLDTTTYLLYSVDPCGCRVSSEWAGAFSAELARRLNGLKPLQVISMTEEQRQLKMAKLTKSLTELYIAQKLAGDQETKGDIDYWIIVIVDQIQRLCPGTHNKATPKPLTVEVVSWADKYSFAKPVDIFNMVSSLPVANDNGYSITYKQPPGFKSVSTPESKITASYEILPNGYHFNVQWSDGTKQGYVSLNEAKMHYKTMVKAVSKTVQDRAVAMYAILPNIEVALVNLSKKLTASPNYVNTYTPDLFPNKPANESVNLYNKLKTTVTTSNPYTSPGSIWPKNLLKTILEYFDNHLSVVYSVVQTHVVIDPVQTTQAATDIRKSIKDTLDLGVNLTGNAIMFLHAFVGNVTFSITAGNDLAPVPAPVEVPGTSKVACHPNTKKRRTIRPIED